MFKNPLATAVSAILILMLTVVVLLTVTTPKVTPVYDPNWASDSMLKELSLIEKNPPAGASVLDPESLLPENQDIDALCPGSFAPRDFLDHPKVVLDGYEIKVGEILVVYLIKGTHPDTNTLGTIRVFHGIFTNGPSPYPIISCHPI